MGARWVYQSSWGTSAPASVLGTGSQLVYGNVFKFTTAGIVVGLRYYRTANDNAEHVGGMNHEFDNELIRVVEFPFHTGATPVGWQHAYFRKTVRIQVNALYNVLIAFTSRRAAYTAGALTGQSIVSGDITQPADSASLWNGFHTTSFGRLGANHEPGVRFGVDALFLPRAE